MDTESHISPSIIHIFAELTNLFLVTPDAQKWGTQSRCVCNPKGDYNHNPIDPEFPNDKDALAKYNEYTKLELAKEWHNQSMFTQKIHEFFYD